MWWQRLLFIRVQTMSNHCCWVEWMLRFVCHHHQLIFFVFTSFFWSLIQCMWWSHWRMLSLRTRYGYDLYMKLLELSQHYITKLFFHVNKLTFSMHLNLKLKFIFFVMFQVNVEGILAFLSVFVVLVKEAAGMLEGIKMFG